jgi:hypothetical protein
MSEDFKKKKCGPLFDDWKKCFNAEVGFARVCLQTHQQYDLKKRL